jgi:hypothetical protein
MKTTYALAVVLFAWTMIGADGGGCALTQIGQPVPPSAQPTPALPYCYTDPPRGCAVVCMDVGTPTFAPQCANVEAGPRTQSFEDQVDNGLATALDQGVEICPADKLGMELTPCALGITPVEWPNQDHESCTPPPPGCPW